MFQPRLVSHAYTGRMADFARFLPLSNRARHDETAVTGDRRAECAAIISEGARLDAAHPGDAGDAWRFAAATGLEPVGPDDELDLEALAARVAAGRRRGVRELSRALRALLEFAAARRAEAVVDPYTCGAVALYGATAGPFDRRAVLKGNTVRASDADWSFGSGPVREAPAIRIAAFLLGVSDDPPPVISSRR